MDELENNDQLWNLLGRLRPILVSPYFARRVLRDIRETEKPSFIPPSILRWLASGALAFVVFGFFISLNTSCNELSENSPQFLKAFDAAAGIDTLVAIEDVSLSSYIDGL